MIALYIALRFEWKYAVPVLIALMHDLLITAGVYALIGREVTTSTVAALLTILGYSLYDTIIVFDRVRENVPRMPRAAFSQIVNRSMSEVVDAIAGDVASAPCCRSSRCCCSAARRSRTSPSRCWSASLSGAYSSIFIASPVLTHWKEREPVYRAPPRAGSPRPDGGLVPAYATTAAGEPVDVAPNEPQRGRGGSPSPMTRRRASPQSEFNELVRDLHADQRARRAAATAEPARRPRRATRPPTSTPRTSCSRTTSQAPEVQAAAQPQAREAVADGHARVGR